MQDKIEKVGKGTLIQHGPLNNRIYLMKLHKDDIRLIFDLLSEVSQAEKYTKLICKVPVWAAPEFQLNGFITEAQIPEFYNGETDVFFMSKFLDSDRLLHLETDKFHELSNVLRMHNAHNLSNATLPDGYKLCKILEKEATEVANLYAQVFDSYPFPIFDPEYIKETINDNVEYYGIRHGDNLIALSSAEMDYKAQNAEMTDFAVLPEYRGKKLAIFLLNYMEKMMQNQNIKTLYTIARLNSIPMNKTFLRLQYKFSGSLIKNTNIAGKIETMNVYYKHI